MSSLYAGFITFFFFLTSLQYDYFLTILLACSTFQVSVFKSQYFNFGKLTFTIYDGDLIFKFWQPPPPSATSRWAPPHSWNGPAGLAT